MDLQSPGPARAGGQAAFRVAVGIGIPAEEAAAPGCDPGIFHQQFFTDIVGAGSLMNVKSFTATDPQRKRWRSRPGCTPRAGRNLLRRLDCSPWFAEADNPGLCGDVPPKVLGR